MIHPLAAEAYRLHVYEHESLTSIGKLLAPKGVTHPRVWAMKLVNLHRNILAEARKTLLFDESQQYIAKYVVGNAGRADSSNEAFGDVGGDDDFEKDVRAQAAASIAAAVNPWAALEIVIQALERRDPRFAEALTSAIESLPEEKVEGESK